MAKTSQAVETLDRLMVQFQGMQEARDQLREIGSFDDALAGRKAALKQAEQDLNDTLTELTKAKLAVDKTLADAQTESEGAKADAKALLEEAKAQAGKIVQEAKDQAAKSLDTAKTQEAGRLKSIRDEIDKATKSFDSLRMTIVQATADANAAKQKAVDAQAALDAIQKQAATVAGIR